jgi:ribosomal protein L11 methyltransferase
MAWHQISIITNENTAPKLADFFSNLGAVSVTYMDAEDEPVYEPGIGETKIWSNTQVIALFELDAEPELIKTLVFQQFKNDELHDWQHEAVADQEWERAWMEYYKPMKFADKLWVCPTNQEQFEAGTVCLTLDPDLHLAPARTRLLHYVWNGWPVMTWRIKTVIDYGCGSGILAVAAILLGANIAHAVDIDPQAITATQCNAIKNNVQDKIKCYLPETITPFSG